MKRPQFQLKDLLLATTLIGIGLGCLQLALTYTPEASSVWRVLAYPVAIPLVTAGIAAPFRRIRLGAYLGFFGQIIAAVAYAAVLLGWKRAMEETVSDWWNQVIAGLTVFVIGLTLFTLARRLLRTIRSGYPRSD